MSEPMNARDLLDYLEDMLQEMPDLGDLPLATGSAQLLTGIDTDGSHFLLEFS